MDAPIRIDIQKQKGLALQWSDGRTTFYSVVYLRKMSPSADMRHLRQEITKNPLTVLPSALMQRSTQELTISDAQLAGHYALKIEFSDGHTTGIYSWDYLREIDPHIEPPPDFAAPTPTPTTP